MWLWLSTFWIFTSSDFLTIPPRKTMERRGESGMSVLIWLFCFVVDPTVCVCVRVCVQSEARLSCSLACVVHWPTHLSAALSIECDYRWDTPPPVSGAHMNQHFLPGRKWGNVCYPLGQHCHKLKKASLSKNTGTFCSVSFPWNLFCWGRKPGSFLFY